jgi:hypothetical protein
MNKFKPISLINYRYKIFTRVLTTRMGQVVDSLMLAIKLHLSREDIF